MESKKPPLLKFLPNSNQPSEKEEALPQETAHKSAMEQQNRNDERFDIRGLDKQRFIKRQ